MNAPAPKAKQPAAKTEASAPAFTLDEGLAVPSIQRVGGVASQYPFKDMKVGTSFLLPVKVPDTIKDADEREAAFKEEARKLSNRISGATRRFKERNEGYDFAIRTVNNDELGSGVRVWRVAEDS